ncbi:MAG: efflux RND transporter permease subunit [Verrucomicrobiota bacterium]
MIAFFARNDIATNILMVAILIAAAWVTLNKVPVEVFPPKKYEEVRISIPYRGGSPTDVERNVAIPVERVLDDLSGIDELRSEVNRGNCRIIASAKPGTDPQDLLEEIKNRVDQLNTFPQETERPRYEVPSSDKRREVITIAVKGDLSEHDLLSATRRVRDEVSNLKGVSIVSINGETSAEISVEADPNKLLQYSLSLSDLSNAIRRYSIDLPAGSIQTRAGNLTLRTTGQAYSTAEFADIPVRSSNGAEVLLGEVATITDGFERDRKIMRYNGQPCLFIEVKRIGDQNALEIADRVKEYVAKSAASLPSGISLEIWDDETVRLRSRISTLLNSLLQGAFLVLLVLGLFLRPTVALWILVGIPVAFAGGLLFMPLLGTSINMMSLFGFIIVLGIVVDDAIVTGENIYTKLRDGLSPAEAAITGTKEVATPVTFGIITTVVAFIPLLFMPDTWQPFVAPLLPVVAMVLLFSLVESKLILPCHLKHLKTNRADHQLGPFARFQRNFSRSLEHFVEKFFQPALRKALHHRYLTLSLFLTIAMIFAGYVRSGKLGFVNLPSIDRDMINVYIQMPDETPMEETDELVRKLYQSALLLKEELTDPATGLSVIKNINTVTGGQRSRGNANPEEASLGFELLPVEKRAKQFSKLRNSDIQTRYRELAGPLEENGTVRKFNIWGGIGGGRDGNENENSITLQVRGPASPEKIAALDNIEEYFDSFKPQGIISTYHNASRNRQEIQLKLKPRALELGINQRDLASQVRAAFFGEQAQRIQRENDDLRVMVRFPEKDRQSLATLDNLILRTPRGTSVPFSAVAEASFVDSPGRLVRLNGAQINEFTADVRDEKVPVMRIAREAEPEINRILAGSGLTWTWTGFVRDDGETQRRTQLGFLFILLALYALLAIPFKSLVQPIFVLLAVPFGIIGAMLGHILLGQTPSWLSVFGILALTGVVVNDSLVLVDFINRRRDNGMSLQEAVLSAGAKRFRPILLTSLTTFAGLLPLIAERSMQAQFLKPMAISLAFGILFATLITLLLIPTAYLISEDLKALFAKFWHWYKRPFAKTPPASEPSATK